MAHSQQTHKLNEMELASFCQQMYRIISAGLPAFQGIAILIEDCEDDKTKALLEQIFSPLQEGSTLHASLEQTEMFPTYMLHMITLGEETGRLDEVLKSLAFYYEREANIQTAIKHAITYPLIMIVMMFVVILVMVTQVLPIFSQVYAELGSDLNSSSRILMNISDFLNHYLIVFVLLIGLVILTLYILYRSKLGRKFFLNNKLAMKIASGRFANCLYLALASGLDTDRGLDLATELVDNPYMQGKIATCKKNIQHGEGFTEALLSSGIFSKMYSSWINIGFSTGSMDEVMEHISHSYQDEVDDTISRFISLLEPTLVIILSVLIGLILMSFILPLLGILSSIG